MQLVYSDLRRVSRLMTSTNRLAIFAYGSLLFRPGFDYLSRTRAVLHHAFRNSLIPIVTILGLQFGVVLTGAVITETIFAWPGIGRLLIQSIGFRDYPTVQGCVLLIAVTYVGVNLITDLTYGFLDPRIRVDRP